MYKTIKTCALSLLLFAGMQAVQAQPTTAAPVPEQDAADVLSLFSDHYTTDGRGPEPQTWGGDAAVTQSVIYGTDDAVLSSSGNSHVVFTSGWSAQTKGYIHLDVWPASDGKLTFGLGVGYSNTLTFIDSYEGWPQLKAGQWNSIDIPILEFVKAGFNDAKDVQAIRFKLSGRYWIDNIYAYGDKQDYVYTVDVPIAPAPTRLAEEVSSVFSDTYEPAIKNDPVSPGYGGNTVAQVVAYESDPAQKVLQLSGLSSGCVNISVWNIQAYDFIHMDVYRVDDGKGDGSFSFGLSYGDEWDGNHFHYMQNYTWPQTIPGQWVGIDVPLDEFDSMIDLKGIILMQFKGSGSFYVDNIYAYKGEYTPPTIAEPTTVPTIEGIDPANVLPIFCEQFEDEGYQDSELGMTDVDAEGNPMNYGQNADQTREFVEIVPGNQTIHLMNWNDYPFKIHKNSTTMDLSGMEYLHASAYLMSPLDVTNKPLTVTFWMHEKEGDQLNPTAAAVTLIPGQWVSFSVPLCHYSEKLDLTKTYVLRFREGGYPAMEVYLDNIFAYKGEPVGTLAPDCEEAEECIPIQNKEDGTLPPEKQPMLGVNLSSASGGNVPGTLNTDYAMPKMEDLYYFNAKGVKLFRFPFRWKRIQSELGGPLVEKDIAAMEAVVAEAERLGMWVMLDMHDYAEYGVNYDEENDILGAQGKPLMPDTTFAIDGRYRTWKSQEDQTFGPWKTADEAHERDLRIYFADVWKKLAERFAKYSNIWGYDLMNEPKGVDLDGLREGYQMTIDAIREVDKRAAIVVEGKNYSGAGGWPNNAAGLENLTDPIGNNIVYEAHCYFDSNNSGTYQNSYDVEIKDFNVYKTRLDPFTSWLKEHGKRGMLGEYGVPYNGAEHSDERYMVLIDSVFSYLKQHQLTSTIWCAGFFYEDNHLSVSPGKDYCTEKSTMAIMEKYITNFHEGWVDDESSIGQMKVDHNLSLYPNPVEDMVTIQGNRPIETVKVYNLFGQVVLEQTLNAVQGKLDLSELTAGNYMLQAEMPNGEISMTHVIKK